MKVAVVGAGIAGLTVAYHLQRLGNEVEVFERDDSCALECSHANGGQIAISGADVWTRWPTLWQGIKWAFKKDAPLLIRKTPSLDKILWMLGFFVNTCKGLYEKNTTKIIKMGLQSRVDYNKIIYDTKIEFDQNKCGVLHVYTSSEAWHDALDGCMLYNRNGVEWNYVSPMDIVRLDPAMSTFKNMSSGFFTPSDWTGDIYKFCTGLSLWLQRNGVEFHYNTEVFDITKRNRVVVNHEHEFDAVVLANGYEINKFALKIGEWVNVYPVKGYSITVHLRPEDQDKIPRISISDGSKRIVTSRLGDDRFRVAGTAELCGANKDVIKERIDPLKQWVRDNFPDVSLENVDEWACLRPMTSDMMPLMRESKVPGIWYHGGHGHLGWTLAAGTGKTVAEKINNSV